MYTAGMMVMGLEEIFGYFMVEIDSVTGMVEGVGVIELLSEDELT